VSDGILVNSDGIEIMPSLRKCLIAGGSDGSDESDGIFRAVGETVSRRGIGGPSGPPIPPIMFFPLNIGKCRHCRHSYHARALIPPVISGLQE